MYILGVVTYVVHVFKEMSGTLKFCGEIVNSTKIGGKDSSTKTQTNAPFCQGEWVPIVFFRFTPKYPANSFRAAMGSDGFSRNLKLTIKIIKVRRGIVAEHLL